MKKVILTELKTLFSLAIPLIFNLLAYMAMQLVDVLMLGRLGALALASSAAGNVMYVIILVSIIGTVSAVGTLAAEAFGEKNFVKVSKIIQQGLWVSIFLCIPAMFLLWQAPWFLLWIKQSKAVVEGARQFLHGLFYGFLPCIIFVTCREFITALCKPRIIMVITVLAIPVNALFNYILMYGKLGLPALGIFGVGLATSLVEWLMLCAFVIYISSQPDIRKYRPFAIQKPEFTYIKSILKLGLPVGISFTVEEFLFAATTLLMGYLGVTSLAAHQIAVQCIYLTAMIPIGICQATAIRVSHALGTNEPKQARNIAYLAIASGGFLAVLISTIFLFFPGQIVGLFINVHSAVNYPVAQLATQLVMILAVFHVIDAIQIITGGSLRGHQDTLIPMFLGIISYWIFGLGSGYVFAFVLKKGAVGLWWGLALGLSVAVILLQLRLRSFTKT